MTGDGCEDYALTGIETKGVGRSVVVYLGSFVSKSLSKVPEIASWKTEAGELSRTGAGFCYLLLMELRMF